MMLVVGHGPVLVQFSIDRENARSTHGVPADIAELAWRGFDERSRVVPMRGSLVRSIHRTAHIVRPVISLVRTRVIYAANCQTYRHSALESPGPAGLPPSDHGIEEAVIDV